MNDSADATRTRPRPGCGELRRTGFATLIGILAVCASAHAEVLVRWGLDEIPPSTTLGLSSIVVAAGNPAAIRNAVAQGYRVYVEVKGPATATFRPPAASLAGVVVRGEAAAAHLTELERRLRNSGVRILLLDERGKWPHIRTNWVTRNNEVLQVTSRSAQPWIENNAALFRILRSAGARRERLLSYEWTPVTIAAADEAPRLEHYLVAIAEAGSFGGGLLLPLHESFQRDLLLGKPQARSDWAQIRGHLDFYAWDLPARYRSLTNIALVTGQPFRHFDVLNLLLRHNLAFDLLTPAELGPEALRAMDLLIVLDGPTGAPADLLMEFARTGGTVVIGPPESGDPGAGTPWRSDTPATTSEDRMMYEAGTGRIVEMRHPVTNPDRFALEMRQLLGRERRVLDIWNGITVLADPYEDAAGESLLITTLNYAHQPLSVQIRVRGTFSLVHHESPEQPLSLLSHTHRDGYTEFVLPALTVGARVFLTGPRLP